MTVTLVTQPATMHAFKTSDLDEVHSLSRKPHQSFTPWTFTWNTFTGLKDRHKPVDNFDNYPVDFSLFWLIIGSCLVFVFLIFFCFLAFRLAQNGTLTLAQRL
ncbi:unnamed protein product [Fusarium graminearum]|uniref:Uncharacterized protein n=1 Tax=Gibberella zeae TaxID=5518 RepID=A0A9N8RJ00_GIBZA|nr:unnamed protein product [Fusarium graminearum]CAG1996349.1 unnamed protein product [Fusarium graminearum]